MPERVSELLQELRDLRNSGLQRFDLPEYDVTSIRVLMLAAAQFSNYEQYWTRSRTLTALINHEIDALSDPFSQVILRKLFGLDGIVKRRSPVDLRDEAMRFAYPGTNVNRFSDDDEDKVRLEELRLRFRRAKGPEDVALRTLEAQIFSTLSGPIIAFRPQDLPLAQSPPWLPADGLALLPQQPTTPAPPESDQPAHSARRVAIALTTAAMLVASALTALDLSNSSQSAAAPNPPPLALTSSPPTSAAPPPDSLPSPATATTKPVGIENVAYLRDGGSITGAWSYVFPQTNLKTQDLADLQATVPMSVDWQALALKKGAVNPEDAQIQIGLRGNAAQTAVITNMDVIKQCRAPLTGTLYDSPGGGGTGNVHIYFDLDKPAPVAKDGINGPGFFIGAKAQTITLNPGEAVTLALDAATAQQYCEFRIRLFITPGGGQPPLTEIIDDNGQPFKVTALVKYPDYRTIYAGGVASPTGDGVFRQVDPATYRGA